jgi:hypothetical protein
MPAKRISGKCNQQTTHKTLSIIGEYILAKISKTDGTKNITHGSGRSKSEQLDFCRNIINMYIRGVEIQLLRYQSTIRVIEIRATMDTRKKLRSHRQRGFQQLPLTFRQVLRRPVFTISATDSSMISNHFVIII